MLKRELVKMGLGCLLGLIIGLILGISSDVWSWLYMMPLYVIGIIYAYQYLFRMFGGVFRWFSGIVGLSLGTANCAGFVFSCVILLILCVLLISFVWIIGIVLAVWSIIRAIQEDGRFAIPRSPFGTGHRRQRETHSAEDEEDDDDSIW